MSAPDRARMAWLLIPEPVRRMPADLAATALLTLVTMGVVLIPVVNETPLRIVFGLPFVLFLPGYAFIAALFPEAGSPPAPESDDADSRLRDRGIDGIERVALSFGLSIAIVPLLGLVLNFTPWGIRLLPILLTVSGFTFACVIVGTVRRWALPADEQFVVPYRDWMAQAHTEVFEPDDRTDALLNVMLALSILLAVSTVGYAVMVPPDGERFTEFYVLTETEDGDLVAANYPDDLVLGEPEPIVVGVENNEHESVGYTVIVQLQDVVFEEANNHTIATVQDREELLRFEASLAHNETLHEEIELRAENPEFVGDDRRVQFLLYADHEGPVPAEPDRENAYRDLHLWSNVTPNE